MPFSGSAPNKTYSRNTGLYTGSTAWVDTDNAGRGIVPADFDTHDQDMAAAINTSWQRNGDNKPTANLDLGGFRLTNSGEPSDSSDLATKNYVDATAAGAVNFTVRAASTANGTLATDFDNGSSFDGLTLATNDRILLKNQTSASENGIWVVAASGAPSRPSDMDAWSETVAAVVNVTAGSTNGGTSWRSTSNAGGTINSTDLNFVAFGTNVVLPLAVASGGTGATSAADAFTAIKQNASTTATGVVEKATDAEVYSATADKYIAADHIETSSAYVALSDGASISLDWDAGVNRSVTLGGNRTLANPSNGQPGTWRTIKVIQDGTGSRTLAYGSNYVFPGGTAPTLTTTAAAYDRLFIFCDTASRFEVYSALNLTV